VEKIDLVVKSGTIVTSEGQQQAGIAIHRGVFVGIMADEFLPPADTVIDASGKFVMSGVIDPHTHLRDPGSEDVEDWTTGTQAAAAGGVTTVCEHPNAIPPVNSPKNLLFKREIAARKSLVDFALFGGAGEENLDQIVPQAAEGIVAYKTFFWPYPDRKNEFTGLWTVDDGVILEIFNRIAQTGLVECVHAENKSIVDYYTQKLLKKEMIAPIDHESSRPVIAEVEAVSRAILFAQATGVRLNIPHLSCGSAAVKIREARQAGYMNITGETCPQYLTWTKERMVEVGPYAKINPPLRTQEEQDLLWECMRDGTIGTIGSDHAPHRFADKEKGWTNIFQAPAGCAGIETSLPVMLTLVNHGKLDLLALTRLMSENVAKLYGLYPRKGAIRVGSDADLVVVDMHKEARISATDLFTKEKRSARLFEGWHTKGAPVMTIVRGKVVMQEGVVLGEPGWGKYIPRLETSR
jgi:allantoinase